MTKGWMIRAGQGGRFIEDFRDQSCVAIGWNDIGELTQYQSDEALSHAYIEQYGDAKPSRTNNAIAMIRKFRDVISAGDMVISYDPERREYLIGEDLGKYRFLPDSELVGDYANARQVKWVGEVSRDKLTQPVRNSLGSTLTLFALPDAVIAELKRVLEGKEPLENQQADPAEVLVQQAEQAISQSHELIKDKIQALSPEEMEQLVAAVLRAMGYRTRVSPKGPDRGVDVVASPDGMGLTQPRIKVEVKHRAGAMGAPAIRSFIGALREGDSALYVSTGGFTKEARYEADRATLPLTLIDGDYLADLIVTHYEQFDTEGRALLPLVKVYWPAE